jgi:hypothetical protein
MLKKNPELAIPAADPFSVDSLGRKAPIELLTKLLGSTKQPFVLSVEAPWGFGKTTFLNLWRAHLERLGHRCLHLNAWQNDFIDDPMVAFLGEIWREVEAAQRDDDAFPLVETWETIKSAAGKLAAHALPLVAEIAANAVLKTDTMKSMASVLSDNAGEITKAAAELTRTRIAHYQSSQQSLKGAREALSKLAKQIAEATERSLPVVFFIDELDRCRPDFAIALPERVKHLFQVEGFFFILAIDREQLGHSIRLLYGAGMNVEGYLRRLIDLSYRLPDPPPLAFAEMLYKRFQFDEVFQGGRDEKVKSEFLQMFNRLSVYFKLSLRVQEQCFTELNLVLRTTGGTDTAEILVCVFLVCYRAAEPATYQRVIRGEIDPLEFAETITEPHIAQSGIAAAVAAYAPDVDRDTFYTQQWCNIVNNREGDESTRRRAQLALNAGTYQNAFRKGSISLVSRLELLAGLSVK